MGYIVRCCHWPEGSNPLKELPFLPNTAALLSEPEESSEAPQRPSLPTFTQPSLAMSFYTLRAASSVDNQLYLEAFKTFWGPWKLQLSQNLTTWMEDKVSQRSDCHAWGGTPICKFMREVCGVKPAMSGWEVIEFKLRTTLFETFECSCAIWGKIVV
ncbi:uncharacterized protein BO97DRAFT_46482 [Aspergillus homomorphus CBS 101889]|uniref:Uncharacterized protein n=1 Tax=Aspergillus homomorphus (strain CBS 101889) TaxID=1450537 RepID=A0A395I117_ASPHC|nr:hypothetical protein BO97DRAFT_46482 [Aspergillus homomorphus CBS 101889]RAL13303.1 hypothetical protein BO97DRAFT_46482 [Aspergillus homomorphus CBS 101889]